ncbi:MAG TPA: bifunctional proline dehydrogenase/L-glutamate gamma-semialdehyde dehydrogenase PutA [Steroidobacteraceae bacterium]|nr:bifunctional proline dehydrogenase/L-glutamate gamma-semialdehyde dehydrogenase PutA [Steroidobacteraceae bacterium]
MSANPAPTAPAFVRPAGTALETPLAAAINALYLAEERECISGLLPLARLEPEVRTRVHDQAVGLIDAVRRNRTRKGGLDAFLKQYDLASREGVILMCLAEALLRIPDAETADRLIADKIAAGNWSEYLGDSDSVFVNASTWGLMLTGRLMRPDAEDLSNPASVIARLATRLGEPVVRAALKQAMRIMGHQFVMGRTMQEALERSRDGDNRQYRYSYDMLGEAAMTAEDAVRYSAAYSQAIATAGAYRDATTSEEQAPSISVKLSALFPRYEYAQRDRVLAELAPRLLQLVVEARSARIALTVDAEECERLELSLELVDRVLQASISAGWGGFGLAVQAYQKRAPDVLRWLINRARATRRRLNIRLVKGAYWDSEIKRAQERGLSGYPVFTRKINTDLSYLACARLLLDGGEYIHPQFATHNAHTVASIMQMAQLAGQQFEFQRLHGMGEELYAEIVGADKLNVPCRVYAPVGAHADLLPYLVRRLLENGANTSFVNRIVDERLPADQIAADPVAQVEALQSAAHPRIPLPRDLFAPERANSAGVNLTDGRELVQLARECAPALTTYWTARPAVAGRDLDGSQSTVTNPANRSDVVGAVVAADENAVDAAITAAVAAQLEWNARGADERAKILEKAAHLFEANRGDLIALAIREAGKAIPDSVAEWREAVDYLRYYAQRARADFGTPLKLPGPTGESNELRLEGRGVFGCISPWNFPLAIFTGQVSAALAAGNAVLAKPAESTPLIAHRAISLLHEAGVPPDVLHFLPGKGSRLGARMVADPRVAGIVFTGSTETARTIQRGLAARSGPIATLIAETGGQNAMLVDSSALPEQVISDVVLSAFNSAGQRCSALRVLFLQEEIADRVLRLLAGYMDEMVLGDPALLATDVGPVIDEASRSMLEAHATSIVQGARWAHRCRRDSWHAQGTYVAPLAVEIDGLERLKGEVFGPILHVIRYSARAIDSVVEAINGTQYGLTLGIHTRIDSVARDLAARLRVGNVYVNRNMIGAVVGVQPFGGRGLSGTGPKAGGPYYLHRFANEQTVTNNTAAVGGNATLLSLAGDA